MPKKICKYYFNGQEFTEAELKSALLSGSFDQYARDNGITLPTMKVVGANKVNKILSKQSVNPSPATSGFTAFIKSIPNIPINVDQDLFDAAMAVGGVEITDSVGDVVAVYLEGEVYADPWWFSNDSENTKMSGMGYVWLEIAKNKDNALYNAIISAAKQTNYYTTARNANPNLSEQEAAQIAAANAIVNEADKIRNSNPSLYEKFKNLISKLGNFISNLMGIGKNMDFMNMSINDFAKIAAKEISGDQVITKITADQLKNANTTGNLIYIEGGVMNTEPGYTDRLVRYFTGKKRTFLQPQYFTNTRQMLKYWFGKNFHASIDKLNETRLANISANMKRAVAQMNELKDQLSKYTKDNNITDSQAKDLIDEINKFMTGKPYNQNLLAPFEQTLQQMRGSIDGMSAIVQQFIDPTASLYTTIRDNMGMYMNRSYAAFKDGKWNEHMFPKGMSTKVNVGRNAQFQHMYNVAYDYVAATYPDLTEAEIDRFLKNISRLDKELDTFVPEKGKLGKALDDFLQKRKDVPAEIRAFLGEYTDPLTSFYHTMENMIRYAENKNFLIQLKQVGMNKMFFEKPSGEFNVEVAKADDYSPLAGLYTTREIAELLKNTDKSFKIEMLRKIASAFKISKTVLSPASIVRNIYSYAGLQIGNGRWSPSYAGKTLKTAWKELNGKPDELVARLTELGVLDSGVVSSELKALINQSFSGLDISIGDEQFYNDFSDKFDRVLSKVTKKTMGLYKFADDIHKIYGYFYELSDVKAMFPNLTKEQQEELAVERLKQTDVFYSNASKAVQTLAKSPLVSTFPTWTSEVMRVTYSIPKMALKDIKDGAKNKNAKQMAIGLRRLSGFAALGTLSAILAKGALYYFGDDDEEERRLEALGNDEQRRTDLERVMFEGSPDWAKGSSKIIVGNPSEGVYKFVDVDWLNPFSVWTRGYNMYTRTAKYDPNKVPFNEFLFEMGKTFTETEAVLGVIGDINKNQDFFGNPIVTSADSEAEQYAKKSAYFLNTLMPGIGQTAMDIYKATKAEDIEQDVSVKTTNDILAQNLLGTRIKSIDVVKQYAAQVKTKYSSSFEDNNAEVRKIFKDTETNLARIEKRFKDGDISKDEMNAEIAQEKIMVGEKTARYLSQFVESQEDLIEYTNSMKAIGITDKELDDKLSLNLRLGTTGGYARVKSKDLVKDKISIPVLIDPKGLQSNKADVKSDNKYVIPKEYLDKIGVKNQKEFIEYLKIYNKNREEAIVNPK
jgi:hypothetical protein